MIAYLIVEISILTHWLTDYFMVRLSIWFDLWLIDRSDKILNIRSTITSNEDKDNCDTNGRNFEQFYC